MANENLDAVVGQKLRLIIGDLIVAQAIQDARMEALSAENAELKKAAAKEANA